MAIHCACRQHSFSRRDVVAVANRWQHCVQFDWPEIWTSDLPLQRRMRDGWTDWSVLVNYFKVI